MKAATEINNRICSACGATARRRLAKYCLDCGKSLLEDYQPLDNLRSSYRLQNQNFQSKPPKPDNLFQKNENAALELTWAFTVYSMVPYLGILFSPGAIFMGCIGAVKAYQKSQMASVKSALLNIAVSFAVLVTQILLWWLLYIIPELGRKF